MSDWNSQIIEEFRANNGRVGGAFEGAPLLLLHHTGAKSGKVRVNPLMYQAVDGGFAVFASKGGAPGHPDWYYNVRANPVVRVEFGDAVVEMKAREAKGAERESIWSTQKANYRQFADYEARTDREIPVFVLER